MLLDAGADAGRRTPQSGKSALSSLLSFLSGWTLHVLKYLLERGLDPNAKVDDRGTPLLNSICASNSSERFAYRFAETLLEAGCDPNRSDYNGDTPLLVWAAAGDEQEQEMAELLLRHGADPGIVNNRGDTALILAAANNSEASGRRIVRLLLDAGATNIKAVNNHNKSGGCGTYPVS
jgi:ankyrin repeat protein